MKGTKADREKQKTYKAWKALDLQECDTGELLITYEDHVTGCLTDYLIEIFVMIIVGPQMENELHILYMVLHVNVGLSDHLSLFVLEAFTSKFFHKEDQVIYFINNVPNY